MELSEELREAIAEEVSRQLDERWNQMVSEARLGAAMRFEPMRPHVDSRGVPHDAKEPPRGGVVPFRPIAVLGTPDPELTGAPEGATVFHMPEWATPLGERSEQ